MGNPGHCLSRGDAYPYDDDGESDLGVSPPIDWAHRAARGVIADLTDRRGIKWGFDNIDLDIRIEIVSSLAEIIRRAEAEKGGE